MLPGPDLVIECPCCRALARVVSLLSGNTFGATRWLDGKVEAPMLFEPPPISRCTACGRLFWIRDARELGEFGGLFGADTGADVPREWKQAGYVDDPGIVEYAEALEQGLGNSREREECLRVHLWWVLNDLVRHGEDPEGFARHRELFAANLEALDDLLMESDPAGQVMRAELARELGEFEKCLVRLTVIPREYDWVCNQLRKLVRQGNRIVQKLQQE